MGGKRLSSLQLSPFDRHAESLETTIVTTTPKTGSSVFEDEASIATPLSSLSDEDFDPAAKRIKLAFQETARRDEPTQGDRIVVRRTSSDSLFDNIFVETRPPPAPNTAGSRYGLRKSSSRQPVQQQKRAKRAQQTSRSQIRKEIATETLHRQDKFFIHNKEAFLPLLPPKNHITKMQTCALPDSQVEEVPYHLLSKQPKG